MATLRTGSNLLQVKSGNLSVVLEAVRRVGLISRTELTIHTHLTPSTITNLVNELLDQNLLVEAGSTASQGGRKRTLLGLNPQACWVMALSCQNDQIKGALVDMAGNIGWHCTHNTAAKADTWLEDAAAVARQLVQAALQFGWRVVGIGWAGELPDTITGWQEWPNKQIVWHSSVPVWATRLQTCGDSVVRAAALAETWFGAGHEVNSLVYLDCMQPDKAGVVLQRELFTGAYGRAATCINQTSHVAANTISVSPEEALIAAVRAVIGYYDPEMVVIGGSDGGLQSISHDKFIDRIVRQAPSMFGPRPKVVAAQLGENAALVGAACLLWREFFADPLGFLARFPAVSDQERA